MRPLLSVVVPTFNHGKYIAQTIQSLRNQTLDKRLWEAVFVDDYSVDDTGNLISESKKYLPNSQLIVQEKNYGTAAHTKNTGILNSEGKHIMMLDGDDMYEPITLEATLDFMKKNPNIRYGYSMHKRVDSKGNFITLRTGYNFSRKNLLHFNMVGAVECFDAQIYRDIGGFRSVDNEGKRIFPEDYDFVLRASEMIGENQIRRNPITLYRYRRHNNNKSKSLDKSRESAARIIGESLRRKEGIETKVFYSHTTKDGYTYFNWREK